MTTEERIKSIICEQLGVLEEKVTPEAKIADDLGADSLDAVELIMAAEEEFEIDITDEDAEKALTVADAVTLVKRLTGEPA